MSGDDPPDLDRRRPCPITLFSRPTVLDDAAGDLAALGYALVLLDAAPWMGAAEMHDAVAAALDFPGYFGRNLDALTDCLGDVATGDYGWNPPAGVAVRRDAPRPPTLARALPAPVDAAIDERPPRRPRSAPPPPLI